MKALFTLGQTVATPGAIEAMKDADENSAVFLGRHVGGDWGEVCEEDAQVNADALNSGERLMSVYLTSKGVKLWVITERGRSATTILLPSEY